MTAINEIRALQEARDNREAAFMTARAALENADILHNVRSFQWCAGFIAGHEARDEKVNEAASRFADAIFLHQQERDEARAECRTLRADLQDARDALATRGELVALDREEVRKAVNRAYYETRVGKYVWDNITDAVMQFGTPAITEERAVAVLVEKGWVKTPVLVYCEQNSNLLRTVPTALVPPDTTGGTNGNG